MSSSERRRLYRSYAIAHPDDISARACSLLLHIRGGEDIDDIGSLMAMVVCVRRFQMPSVPGCGAATTACGTGVVVVSHCHDGDTWIGVSRRGRPFVAAMVQTTMTSLEQVEAAIPATLLATAMLQGYITTGLWPRSQKHFIRQLSRGLDVARQKEVN